MNGTQPLPESKPHVGTIFRGQIITHHEHPGVSFVLAYPGDLEASGQPLSGTGWPRPVVVVSGDLSPAQVEAAAAQVGRSFGHAASLRRAARSWAKSVDCQNNPHKPAVALAPTQIVGA